MSRVWDWYYITVLCFFLTCFCGIQPATASVESIEKVLHRALKATGISEKNISVLIYDLDSGKNIFSHNDSKLLSIASLNKLFITASAVSILGQDFRFKTMIYGDQPDSNGIINGNIYIKGYGDPLFVSETMWYLVNRLVNLGIKEIRGNIILDDSAFSVRQIEGTSKSDRAYSAKISPVAVNFNSIAINVVSGKNPGVFLDPSVPSIKLIDKTSKGAGRTKFSVRRHGDNINVFGTINNRHFDFKSTYRNVSDTLNYFSEVLALHLKDRGINFNIIKKGKVPDDVPLKYFEIESRRLSDLLSDMNRFSNNYIAEQLLGAIAVKTRGEPADFDAGLEQVEKYLKDLGLSSSQFRIVNASGLSRDNRCSAKTLLEFLKIMYRDFRAGPEFVNSLSISGMDGTIERTINSMDLKGRVRAKTGTMSGIRGLAGYLKGDSSVMAFVIISNDGNAQRFVDWEPELLKEAIR